jgi:hypothetical protein
MTAAWSRAPFPQVVRRADLGTLGVNLSENNGESRRVCLLPKYADWIFKEYLEPLPAEEAQRLGRLIHLPGQLPGSADRALVDEHTCWPAARVVNTREQTVGALMPLAPPKFRTQRQLTGGRTKDRSLDIDVLALTEERQYQIGVQPQSLADRISVCASAAAVGALFERQGLVYLDWSYANVFWSMADHSAYVIDLDGSSFGPRPQIQTHGWDDPQVPRGGAAGNESDRYRVALLAARCLTGLRTSVPEAQAALNGLRALGPAFAAVARLLNQTLNARSPQERASVTDLSAALSVAVATPVPAAGPGSVRQWKPLSVHGTRNGSAQSGPDRASPDRAGSGGATSGGVRQWKPLTTPGNPTPRPGAPPGGPPPASAPSAPAAAAPVISPPPAPAPGPSGGSPAPGPPGGIVPSPPTTTNPLKVAAWIVGILILLVILSHL